MSVLFAERMKHVPRSFIRDILDVTERPEVISFAGGLPNPAFFPVKEIEEACSKVLQNDGRSALQYAQTPGYAPLRQWIANRYRERKGIDVQSEEILITNGSQQAIDLIGKILLDQNDRVVVERPGYLGALQSLSMFRPTFVPVELREDGIDIDALDAVFQQGKVKLFYAVSNFQNPTGITYTANVRQQISKRLCENQCFFVEDNPYGELRFLGEDQPSIRTYCPDQSILLGSFSKIFTPAFRLGWICAKKEIMDQLIVAKQAADLHTNSFAQRVVYQFLCDNDLEAHINKIRTGYRNQRNAMVKAIQTYFPETIHSTQPEGGMFLWLTLPNGRTSMDLFNAAIQENVAFVPGYPFYVDGGGQDTLRLNFSNVNEERIEEGIRRLAKVIGK